MERAVLEHAATVRLRCGRHGGIGAGAAGKPEERKSESGVFHIFFKQHSAESVGPFGRRRRPTDPMGSDALTQHYR